MSFEALQDDKATVQHFVSLWLKCFVRCLLVVTVTSTPALPRLTERNSDHNIQSGTITHLANHCLPEREGVRSSNGWRQLSASKSLTRASRCRAGTERKG